MRFLRILITAFVLATGLVPLHEQVSAQETTATSTLSGLVIDIGTSGEGSFANTSPEPYDDWGYWQEDFLINLDQAEVHISFAQGNLTTESWFAESHENLAGFYDAYAVLDEEVAPERGWALTQETYMLHYELTTYFEFYFQDVDDVSLGVSIHTTENRIIEYVEWIQNNVSVGGDPVGLLADRDRLDSLVNGTAGVEPREVSGFTSTVSDWEDSGLVSETEWTSPNFQTPVEWDADLWQFPFYKSNAILTNGPSTEDVITLATPDRSGLTYIYASENPPGYTPVEWDAWWQSIEFRDALNVDGGTEITLLEHIYTDTNSSAIVHSVDKFGHVTIIIVDTYLHDSGNAVTVYLIATPDNIADVYGHYWNGVMAYGDYYPLAWSLEEIDALEFE